MTNFQAVFCLNDGAVNMFFLKGILIGLIVGMPAGAIGALCVQRMLTYGTKSGIMTGLGSSVVDCFYAAVGAFGITLVSDLMIRYQASIMLVGGLLILAMGINILRKTQDPLLAEPHAPSMASMLISSIGVGITNPAAIIGFLFSFTYFGINGKQTVSQGLLLVFGVLIGTLIWWVILALITGFIQRKFGDTASRKLNLFFGFLMIIFSGVVFIKAILRFWGKE